MIDQSATVSGFRKAIALSLGLFTLAAALGLILRLAFVINMPEWIDYRSITHAHSHIALLGWLFGALYLVIIKIFGLPFQKYLKLYWLLQASVAAMAITFPIIGYAPASIALTTIHILMSYIFVIRIWRDLNRVHGDVWPVIFLKSSLVFLVISTLGTWALGPIMAFGLKGGALYYGAIQFYLHFQFNGWLVFTILAIMLQHLKTKDIDFPSRQVKGFYILLTISTILTFALAVTWSTPYMLIFALNSVGVIIQLAALAVALSMFRGRAPKIRGVFSTQARTFILIAAIALILKVVIQTAVVIPVIAAISYTIRNFVVGFIHLLMLGCLSTFLFVMIAEAMGRKLRPGAIWTFIIGVVMTELLLFAQGYSFWMGWGFIPMYYAFLALFSGIILLGVAWNTLAYIQFKE